MIKGVIFDLDGLLIDSEPLWRKAERKVFETVGISLGDGDFEHFVGYKISEVVDFWHQHKPWETPSKEMITSNILDELEVLIEAEGLAKPGVIEILDFFKHKKLPMVVASSSPLRIIKAALNKLGILGYFEALFSAEFEAYGKPHPAVFLTAIQHLGFFPKECLVFEDSFNGLIASKAARATTVSVPDGAHFTETRFDIADLKLITLSHWNENHWERLNLRH